MATSVLPTVVRALHTAATTALPDIQVYAGFGISDDPGDFLMILAEDPDRPDAANAAEFRQEKLAMGGSRKETGTINCVALSWNGDGGDEGQLTALDTVFDIIAAVEDLLRGSPTLGVPGVLMSDFTLRDSVLNAAQGDTGAACWVPFSVTYQATI